MPTNELPEYCVNASCESGLIDDTFVTGEESKLDWLPFVVALFPSKAKLSFHKWVQSAEIIIIILT